MTSKSYSPDQPGDYAGGLVQLQTRDFPSNRIFKVSVSGGWNSMATREAGIGYAAGGYDILGFDDGTRGLPDLVPMDVPVTSSNFSDAQLEEIGESFQGAWGPTDRTIPFDGGLGISYGDDFDFGESQRAGFIASFDYSADQSLRTNSIERVFASAGVDDPEVDYRGTLAQQSVTLGGLLNLTYQPRRRTRSSSPPSTTICRLTGRGSTRASTSIPAPTSSTRGCSTWSRRSSTASSRASTSSASSVTRW